jgi:MFS family permease
LGPLIGGYFTDHGTTHIFGHLVAGWRWVFYLNLPLSILSLFMILVKMPKMSHQARGKIDFIGAGLIIATVVPLLLALTFGGHQYAWTSPTVLGLFAGSVLGLVLYIFAERFARDPILPLELFKNPVFSTANLAGFLVSMSFMSTVAFLPLFQQLGQGVAATTSGLSQLPLMFGLFASSILCGRLVSKTGKYKGFMVGGVIVTFIGIWLLSRMHAETTRLDLAWRMLVLGIGLGPGQSLFSIAIQNAMPIERLGVVTSSSQFFRQIGSTMGVAIFGTFLTANLNSGLGKVMPGVDVGKLRAMGGMTPSGAAPMLPQFIRDIISDAITGVFALGLYVVAAALLVTLLIPRVPMRDLGLMGAQASKKDDGETVIPAEAHL